MNTSEGMENMEEEDVLAKEMGGSGVELSSTTRKAYERQQILTKYVYAVGCFILGDGGGGGGVPGGHFWRECKLCPATDRIVSVGFQPFELGTMHFLSLQDTAQIVKFKIL